MPRKTVREIVNALLTRRERVTSGEVAARARISRQAAHRHLRAMAVEGEVVPEGAGRGARYRRGARPLFRKRYRSAGLAEDAVWGELVAGVPEVARLSGAAQHLMAYAFTELLNNAIEHAGSRHVDVILEMPGGRLAFEVIDRGVGVFERVRAGLKLAGPLEALQELSKGKVTTRPEGHTGEGIFFVSRAGEAFELESGGWRWTVDNLREDSAAGRAPPRKGTRVRFELDPRTRKTLEDLFAAYTEKFEFSRTRIHVKLFEYGVRFLSRSEGRRLMHRLERFREAILDFKGVDAVGQGFCDEVFRVWPARHKRTRVVPVHMNPAVEFMVRRTAKK